MKVEFDNIIPFLYQEEALTDLEREKIYVITGEITQVSKIWIYNSEHVLGIFHCLYFRHEH